MQKPSPICVPGRRGGVVGPLGADGLLAGRHIVPFPLLSPGLHFIPLLLLWLPAFTSNSMQRWGP